MTSLPTYLTTLREGRLVVYRTDGVDMTETEREWFRSNMTVQLRTDKLMQNAGKQLEAALAEPDIEEGAHAKTGKVVRVHPLLNQAKRIITRRGWRLAAVSEMLGRRSAAVSTWFRGQATPSMQDLYALFGLAGYKLVPVPLGECLTEVESMVRIAEEMLQDEVEHDSVG